ncbi:hypothetical protein [Aridibaculum aurantiacum]|uniref:hypothetical protein n=1 Tax=Aridibaculum aurantiacum TaxID=2810307 RepID=UPI001A95DEEF|nr:hypothetical protein [Aridibaculum aurantiacum]
MENNNEHKGSEFKNVQETWDQNEQNDANKEASADAPATPATNDDALQQTIKNEATEYDQADKEERLLGGERATVNDDQA